MWTPDGKRGYARGIASYAVESGIEGSDLVCLVVQHYCGVDGVPAGYTPVAGKKIPRPIRVGQSYVQDDRTDSGKEVVTSRARSRRPSDEYLWRIS